MAYKDVILSDNPILYVTFDEAGSTIADSSTAARTVTPSGNPVKTAGITGVAGTALTFDGVDDSVSAASVADSTGSSMTWEVWFKSTQTTGTGHLVRRDGSGAAYLLRLNNGKIEWYGNNAAGTTLSPTVKADGQWHHVVGVKNGTALTLYIDGVSVDTGTATSVYTGTTNVYLGSAGGTGEFFNGTLDEVALYNTALTSARIQAHFAAGPASTTGSFGAAGKATGKGGSFTGLIRTISQFGTATATGNAGNYRALAEGPTDYQRVSFTDGWGSSGGAWSGEPYFGPGEIAAAIFDLSSFPANATFTEAILVIKEDNNQSSTGILLEKAESFDKNVPGKPTVSGPSVIFDIEALHSAYIDVTDMLNSLSNRAAPTFGVGPALIFSGGTGRAHFSEAAATGPRIMVKYTLPVIGVSGAFGTGYATGLASMDARSGTSVVIGSATAIGASSDWTANATVDPNTQTFFGTAYGAGQASLDYTHHEVADFGTAAGSATGGTFTASTVYRVIGVFGTAYGTGKAIAPVQSNPISDDYAQAIMTSLNDTNDQWYMPTGSGQVAVPVTVNLPGVGDITFGKPGNIVGSVDYNVQGPEGRPAYRFNNAYIDVNTEETGMFFGFWSFETVIRTTQKNAHLMYGYTAAAIAGDSHSYIGLNNGKIRLADHLPDVSPSLNNASFTGNKDVADGQWHHIVVNASADGVEVWIDGLLDSRRGLLYRSDGQGVTINMYARPDVYLGRGDTTKFTGDVMNIVWRDQLLETSRIRAHSNAVFGIQTNFFSTARAVGNQSSIIAKGNVPEALVLWFRTNGFDITEQYWQPIDNSWQPGGDYDFDPQIKRTDNFYGNFHIEHADVLSERTYYIDPITGDPRFRNLDTELDLSKYDAVLFRWYPNEGVELDRLLSAQERLVRYMPAAYTKMRLLEMLETLRTAIDKHGTSLLITNPSLAVDMGIIDRVELVPSMVEFPPDEKTQGLSGMAASIGHYDPRGADIDPWLNPTGVPGGNKAPGQAPPEYYYWDTHHNNRFKVRNLVPGLTDVPGWIKTDLTWYQPHQQWELERSNSHWEDRTAHGLDLNDEFLFDGPRNTPLNENYGYGSATSLSIMRWHGFWATPVANVKAGTIVTTFGDKVYMGRTQVDNPYRNYATSIALQPGEMLNGKPLGAKIFVSFTEQVWNSEDPYPVKFQRVPAEANETDLQKYWQYSWWRVDSNKTPTTGSNPNGIAIGISGPINSLDPNMQKAVNKLMSDGQWIYKETGARSVLYQISIAERYVIDFIGIRFPMLSRGLFWLADRTDIGPGGVLNRWNGAKAAAKAGTWSTSTGLSAKATWGTARAQAQASFGGAGSTRGFFGTASARAKAEIKQVGKWIAAKATGKASMTYNVVYDASEIVTLYVESGRTITLYLEEES